MRFLGVIPVFLALAFCTIYTSSESALSSSESEPIPSLFAHEPVTGQDKSAPKEKVLEGSPGAEPEGFSGQTKGPSSTPVSSPGKYLNESLSGPGREARSISEGYGRGVKTQTALSALNVGFSESVMGWVEKSVDDLPSFPRLDAQECMKRCICEAHNQPKKYGLTGLVLQLFFPPYTETDEPSRIVSKYQLAARYGRQDSANCAAQYDGCMVNFLDMVQGLINLVF